MCESKLVVVGATPPQQPFCTIKRSEVEQGVLGDKIFTVERSVVDPSTVMESEYTDHFLH